MKINFLPSDAVQKPEVQWQFYLLRSLSIFLIGALCITLLCFNKTAKRYHDQQAQIKVEAAHLVTSCEAAKQLKNEKTDYVQAIAQLKKLQRRKQPWANFLAAFQETNCGEIKFREITLKENNGFIFKGTACQYEKIVLWMDRLEESKKFKQLTLGQMVREENRDQVMISFCLQGKWVEGSE